MGILSNWERAITKLNKFIVQIFLFITVMIITTGCFTSSGKFAYKMVEMDSYRAMSNGMEFRSDKKADWLYKFSSVFMKTNVGVIMLKHELVWVEIKKDIQTVDKTRTQVWGSFENLEPGEYKIMITDKDKMLDEITFNVFDPANDEDEDDE